TEYVPEEEAARSQGLGVWQAPTEAPWDYRANSWERAAEESPRPGCPIKGNINQEGERIYHTPWSPWYSRTRINEADGERWFCDQAEAIAAGWRAARFR
ncbi:MAG: thermonuclease family protein, partial [Rhodobacteraceae bacterium]|nr:thermonuclease family protein [Paracoccaceae bacterium]